MCKATVKKCMKYIETNARRNEFAKKCTTTWEYEGIAYCTDSYQILRTLEEIDESKIHKQTDSMMNTCEEFFDDKYLGECEAYELPEAAKFESEIKNLKAKCKSKNRPLWQVRVGYSVAENILVNAEYLLNAMKATGENTTYCAGKYKPLMFLGEDTQYLLLPINHADAVPVGEMKILH